MRLTWHGHATFRLESDRGGPTIVTDPYHPDISGYRPLTRPADVVVRCSPTDRWHNNLACVPGSPTLVEALELARRGAERTVGGVRFRATEAFEADDANRGRDPEANAIYRFAVDGIEVAHLGDVGTALDARQLAFLEGTEVLLAPTGGPPTIPLPDLLEAVDRLRPKLVVPMHFQTLRIKHSGFAWIGAWLEPFGERFGAERCDFAHSESVVLTEDDLPEATRTLVLDYA